MDPNEQRRLRSKDGHPRRYRPGFAPAGAWNMIRPATKITAIVFDYAVKPGV